MVKNAQIEDFCLLALSSLKSYKEYLLEDVLRKYINGKNLISEFFYPSYDCFIKVYKELVKKNKSSFYNLVVPFINSEKEPKNNNIEWGKIEEILYEKTNNKNISSIYYCGLYDLLKGGRTGKDMNSKQKNNLKNIIGFIYLLENYSSIDNIENKFQGAMLYLLTSFFNEKKFMISVISMMEGEKINIRETIKGLISGLL